MDEEQRDFFFSTYAKSRMTRRALRPSLRAAWRERFGLELTEGQIVHYAYHAKWEARRAAAIEQLAEDPNLKLQIHPLALAEHLHGLAEEARRGHVTDLKPRQDPEDKDRWTTCEIRQPDFRSALEAYRLLLEMSARLGELQGAAGSPRAAIGKSAPRRSRNPEDLAAASVAAIDDTSVTPADAEALLAQEESPFVTPPTSPRPARQHLDANALVDALEGREAMPLPTTGPLGALVKRAQESALNEK